MSRLLFLFALILLLAITICLYGALIGGLPHDAPPGAFMVVMCDG
jgi:predicted ABC-type exoprotein transport system permease subunit